MTRLLVIDDDRSEQDSYAEFLAGTGVELLFCTDGAAALRLVEREGLGGVVLAWELPGPPASAELLSLLRRRWPGLPVIVLSGLLDFSRAARARALGASDFLLKPLERDRLRAAVLAVLGPSVPHPLLENLRGRLIGNSPAFLKMLERLAPVIASQDEPILLLGENGTGKEVLARAIHDLGARDRDRTRWTTVNVASIPPTLVEATLFGHEEGAFTGATSQRVGLFEECGAGTLFLDEIGELEAPLQAKLLRVIQERQFRRIGGRQDLAFAARLVCATNRDLVADEKSGRFRTDLYHRIAGHEIRVPPLRDRGDDVWLFADHFLQKHAPRRSVELARETRELLRGYPFPGNVRELENLIKDALLRCPGTEILPYHLPIEIMEARQVTAEGNENSEEIRWPATLFDLPQKQAAHEIEKAFDRSYLPRKLSEAGGNVTRAARAAGLDPKTFRKKWEEAGLGPLSGTR
jgi:DNA-binding NtrC family response regulator